MNAPFANFVLGTALALMIGFVLHVGKGVILPVLAGVMIVYVIVGVARLLGRIPVLARLPQAALMTLSFLSIGALLLGMMSLVITNLGRAAALLPLYQDEMLAAIQRLATALDMEETPTWETLRAQVFDRIDIESTIGFTVGTLSAIVWTFTVIVIYAGFLMGERRILAGKLHRVHDDPERVRRLRSVLARINDRIGVYLGMKTLVNVMLGLLSWIVMKLAGVELAAFWAVLIGFLNYIPYVGSFLGVIFPVALSALQYQALAPVALILLALTAVQIFMGNVVEPWIMGASLNLSPFVIMVSLSAWSAIWGIPGALLAVPITAILVIVLSEFAGTRPIAVMLTLDGRLARTAPADQPGSPALPAPTGSDATPPR